MMLASLLTLFLGCVERTRTPIDYEIPGDYLGWLIVEFGREDCSLLRRREGRWVVAFSSSGEACTSTKMELGVARDQL